MRSFFWQSQWLAFFFMQVFLLVPMEWGRPIRIDAANNPNGALRRLKEVMMVLVVLRY